MCSRVNARPRRRKVLARAGVSCLSWGPNVLVTNGLAREQEWEQEKILSLACLSVSHARNFYSI